MPPAPEWVRAAAWRQGSLVRRGDHQALLTGSVDRVPELDETPFRLVVVTQDCDLAREPGIEPLYLNGRNPRLLHIRPTSSREPIPWLEISIHDRFRVEKEALAGLSIDETARLEVGDVRLLSRWIAKRYTRPAFPDAFNRRLETVDRQLERLFRSRDGRVVTGVFLDVADDEHPDDEPYAIAVRITAKAESWEEAEFRDALLGFEERFSSILDGCGGIVVADDDIRVLPEDDLTLADLRRFRRLDKDYRSLPERDGVAPPADGGDEL